jgi:hypothetical protein
MHLETSRPTKGPVLGTQFVERVLTWIAGPGAVPRNSVRSPRPDKPYQDQ